MKLNDKLHGFTVKGVEHLMEIGCNVYTLEYDKNRARLVFFDRDDDNKTFSISFKTLPTDSTGVFHILEHSVLCGSEKYPLKDPFVELLKGSLNTFLNAMTFQDKTMYPVASRNEKDFLNLVSIYLDAVFSPLAVKNKNAFLQEGWHYEIGEGGELEYNGVVYNEMRGDYASVDSVIDRYMNDMLYAGTPYAYDSGGDPDEIVKLDFDAFKKAHETYYHPSNAEIFLDGAVDLDKTLALIDSYLCGYEYSGVAREMKIARANISEPRSCEAEYEVSESEGVTDRTRMSVGTIIGDFSELEKMIAMSIINTTLFSTNESVIKKQIIASGLCEDMIASVHDGIYEPSVTFDFINIKDGCEEELYKLFYDSLGELLASGGMDKEELYANLNFSEFRIRERDFGSLPIGVAYAMTSLESLLYSDDAVQNLRFNEALKNLRSGVETGYFDRLLEQLIINNKKTAKLVLHPSTTLGEKKREARRTQLEALANQMTDAERENIEGDIEALTEWQNRAESDEALATIPTLTLEDIEKKPARTPTEIGECQGIELIRHPIGTNGITYAEMWFDITDITKDELSYVALLNFLLGNLETDMHSATEIQRLVKSKLGGFDTKFVALTKRCGDNTEPKMYFTASASVLEINEGELAPIINEILCHTRFDDFTAIKNIIRQTVISTEESFSSTGHQIGLARAAAASGIEAAAREYYNGYEAYLFFKELDSDFENRKEEIRRALISLVSKYAVRERLTVSITSCGANGLEEKLISAVGSGDRCAPVCNISTLPVSREGIVIPADIGFATVAYNMYLVGSAPKGSFDVARVLIGYEYLWTRIRVKGGAYGAGMSAGISGTLGFYSYRDPNPAASLEVMREVAGFLREFANSGADITKYVIGAIGDANPIKTPRMRGLGATQRYLRGISYEDECALRESMLATDKDELLYIAGVIEKCVESAAVCVVGAKGLLDGAKIEKIMTI